MEDGEDFVVVKSKRRVKMKSKPVVNPPVPHEPTSKENDIDAQVNMQSLIERINSCKQDILLSDFFSKNYDNILSCLNQMCCGLDETESRGNDTTTGSTRSRGNLSGSKVDRKELHILSYGIGNFTSCLIARYQLAFLLALKDKLESSVCEVFDPVFTTQEKAILLSQKCQVLPHNEEGKRSCHTCTIAFMPHCGKALYNNFLWKNAAVAESASLFNFLLIGNSFDSMLERTPSSQLKKTANYVIKLQPYINETKIENSFIHKDIFNDLAMMWFPSSRLGAIQISLGNCEEPVYLESDVELISS